MNLITVGIGGFFGASLRYLIGQLLAGESGFPIHTLFINLLGCFFLAWFFTITTKRWNINPSIRLGIGTGLTGAFTTFSTFSVETLTLLHNNQVSSAIFYVFMSVIGGIFFSVIGAKLAQLSKWKNKEVNER